MFTIAITTLIFTVSTITSTTTFFSKHIYFLGNLFTKWNPYVTDWYICNIIFKDEVGLDILKASQVSKESIIHLLAASPMFHELSNVIGHTVIMLVYFKKNVFEFHGTQLHKNMF